MKTIKKFWDYIIVVMILLIPLMLSMVCCNPSERIKYPDQKTSYKQANKSKTYPVPNKRKQARARIHCIEYKHDFSPKKFPQ